MGFIIQTIFFPVMEGFGQIALIYLPSVSCLPLFLSLPADIDECQVHNGGCQHRCVNTRGSYYCECHIGSRLHVDKRTCLGEVVILRRLLIYSVSFLLEVANLYLDWQKHTVVAKERTSTENFNPHVHHLFSLLDTVEVWTLRGPVHHIQCSFLNILYAAGIFGLQ